MTDYLFPNPGLETTLLHSSPKLVTLKVVFFPIKPQKQKLELLTWDVDLTTKNEIFFLTAPFFFPKAAPMACRSSQARDPIQAATVTYASAAAMPNS